MADISSAISYIGYLYWLHYC